MAKGHLPMTQLSAANCSDCISLGFVARGVSKVQQAQLLSLLDSVMQGYHSGGLHLSAGSLRDSGALVTVCTLLSPCALTFSACEHKRRHSVTATHGSVGWGWRGTRGCGRHQFTQLESVEAVARADASGQCVVITSISSARWLSAFDKIRYNTQQPYHPNPAPSQQ